MQYTLIANNAKERSAFIALLLELGLKWHGEGEWTLKSIDDEFPFEDYANVIIEWKERYKTWDICGCNSSHNQISIDKVISIISDESPVSIDHIVERSGNVNFLTKTIVVGCQTYTFDDLKQALEIIENTTIPEKAEEVQYQIFEKDPNVHKMITDSLVAVGYVMAPNMGPNYPYIAIEINGKRKDIGGNHHDYGNRVNVTLTEFFYELAKAKKARNLIVNKTFGDYSFYFDFENKTVSAERSVLPFNKIIELAKICKLKGE